MRSLHTQQLESSTHFPKLEKFDVQQQRPSVARKKKKKKKEAKTSGRRDRGDSGIQPKGDT